MSDERASDGDEIEPGDDGPTVDETRDRTSGSGPLAVVVDEARAEIAIESLRAEGVYDDERAVRPYGDGRIALPVDRPPESTRVHAVVRQVDPDYRVTDLDALLAERGWSDAARARAPGSWAVVGDVVLVTIPPDCPDEVDVAEALLELHGGAETVLADEGVRGTYREPRTRHLAGERDTETVHVEHGTAYGLDPAAVMFSPGNQAERARMGDLVDPGERVWDMFAGIGYFTLPMARAGATVTATEPNPTAFRYLVENAVRNEVTDRVAAYNADCRDLAETLTVDRVVMGYYGVSARTERESDGSPNDGEPPEKSPPSDPGRPPKTEPNAGRPSDQSGETGEAARRGTAAQFLPSALDALRPGGTVHYHEAVHESELEDGPRRRLIERAGDRGRTARILDQRRVKTHSAGVVHVVIDAEVT